MKNAPLFLILAAFIFSGCFGEALDFSPTTTIHISNNSDKTLTIDVNDSPASLTKGQHWTQLTTTVAPYTSAAVLELNREQGMTEGEDYLFVTHVEDGSGKVLALTQNIKGTAKNSSLAFGVSADDVLLSLESGGSIYRHLTAFLQTAAQPTEVAFKTQIKARFDDVYYALTPAHIDEVHSSNKDTLTLMTYNIWALPSISEHIPQRLARLPDYLHGYDALLLQEVFSDEREAFLLDLAAEYPYQSNMLDKAGSNVYDGGVIIVSRYPIVNQAQFVYPDCAGADCLADKGINYVEIIKEGRAYHLFATHTASFDTNAARTNRQIQFNQMREFALTQTHIAANETVIFGGDLNVNKLKFPGDYQQMLDKLQSSEPTYAGYTASTFDPRVNIYANAFGSGSNTVEYLDYILVSNAYRTAASNVNTVNVPRNTDADLWQHWDLSDHFPVKAVIQ